MADAPEKLFCWNFQTEQGAWEKGWGGYARPQNLAPMDDRERATGAVYVRADLHAAASARAEAALAERDALRAEVERLREAQTKAATDVLLERQRQISAEGWTHGHDDAHMRGELATAASAYAAAAGTDTPLRELIERGKSFPDNWPWHASWWKPTSRRRDLVKAGSLILAEIERLDRAALREGGDNG
jgi:hypothetical protein